MGAELGPTIELIRQQLQALLPEARPTPDPSPSRVGPGLSTTVYRSGVQQFRLGQVHLVTVQIRSPIGGTNYVTGRQIDDVATAAESLLDWLAPPNLTLLPLLIHWPTGVTADYGTDEGATATITIPLVIPEEYGRL